jgi:hypothetical protein
MLVKSLNRTIALLAALLVPALTMAHCDTLDGPVVADARAAIEKGDVTPILKWVKPEAEPEIRTAFQKTLTVRAKGPEAKDLADVYFFETLVRVHRAGEGAPYTGLKAAGSEVEPGIVMADKALETGSVDELAKTIASHVDKNIRQRYQRVLNAKKDKDKSVEAGREYVEAYVVFIHYVEALINAIHGAGAPHAETGAPAHAH